MGQIIGIATALAVAYVALRQWLTDRHRLQHELFERRYAVYEATADYLGSVVRNGRVNDETIYDLLRKTRTSYFVFSCDEQVKLFFEEVGRKSGQLTAIISDIEDGQSSDRARAIEKRQVLFRWHVDTLSGLDARFAKFLKLGA